MIWRLLDAGLLLLGAGCVVVGVAQVHPAGAWIVGGLSIIALAVVPGRPTR